MAIVLLVHLQAIAATGEAHCATHKKIGWGAHNYDVRRNNGSVMCGECAKYITDHVYCSNFRYDSSTHKITVPVLNYEAVLCVCSLGERYNQQFIKGYNEFRDGDYLGASATAANMSLDPSFAEPWRIIKDMSLYYDIGFAPFSFFHSSPYDTYDPHKPSEKPATECENCQVTAFGMVHTLGCPNK
jgi:hypothetical protein